MKRKLIVLSCLGITMATYGQNLTNLKFSNPLLVNPAYTGITKTPELNLSSSTMFSGDNQTYLGFSKYSKKLHGGIGVYTNNVFWKAQDNSQSSHTNSLGFSYAYQNRINEKWSYSLGTSANIANTNWTYFNENGSFIDLDLKIGGLIYTDKFYTSLNYNKFHSLEAGRSFTNHSDYQLEFGYKIKPFKTLDLSFTPSVTTNYYHSNENGNNHVNMKANVEAQYKKLHIGIGLGYARPNASIGYDFNRFRINYNMGSFGNIIDSPEYTTHQFSLKFKFKDKSNNAKRSSFNFNLF